MATGSTARQLPLQAVHFLRKSMVFGDAGTALTVGTIPSGSTILKPASGFNVDTVFNGGTSAVVDIGTSADGDLYATDLDAKTAIAFLPLDEAVAMTVSADTTITATLAVSGAITTGAGEVIIAYIPDMDG